MNKSNNDRREGKIEKKNMKRKDRQKDRKTIAKWNTLQILQVLGPFVQSQLWRQFPSLPLVKELDLQRVIGSHWLMKIRKYRNSLKVEDRWISIDSWKSFLFFIFLCHEIGKFYLSYTQKEKLFNKYTEGGYFITNFLSLAEKQKIRLELNA